MLRRNWLTWMAALCIWPRIGRTCPDVAASGVDAFAARNLHDAFAILYGNRKPSLSDAIRIDSYRAVEDGAFVPLKLCCDIPGTHTLALFVEHNPWPLITRCYFGPGTAACVETRIKMARSSDVIVIAETDTGLYRTQRMIEVHQGGCAEQPD